MTCETENLWSSIKLIWASDHRQPYALSSIKLLWSSDQITLCSCLMSWKNLRLDTFSAHSLTSGKSTTRTNPAVVGQTNHLRADQPPFLPPTTNWGRSNFATQSTQGSFYSQHVCSPTHAPAAQAYSIQMTAHLYVGKMSLLGWPLYLAP